MNEEDIIKKIKESKKFKRQFEDYTNYFILLFPLAILVVGFIECYGYLKNKTGNDDFLVPILLILFGLFTSYFTLKRLNENISFETIENKNNLSVKKLKEDIEKNFRIKTIQVEENLELIEVLTKISGFSWGERITILRDGNTYLINSKPNQPITIYKDKANINKIRKILCE
jgi:hypothetical protein